MKGLSDLMKQAQEMQKNIEAAQQELIAKQVEGVALAGNVKVVMNGRYNAISVYLSDNIMTENKAVLQDAIVAAINDAAQKIEDFSKAKMGSLMQGANLPQDFGNLEG